VSRSAWRRSAQLAGKATARPDGELEAYLGSLGKESLGRALVIIADKLTR